jgi:mono/diheme cytochrome c family protein
MKLMLVMATVVAGTAALSVPAFAQVKRLDTTILYLKHCSSCHGLKGEAKDGVPALTGALKHGSSQAQIEAVIRDGIKDTTMTGFGDKITEAQIKSLAGMVREFAPR